MKSKSKKIFIFSIIVILFFFNGILLYKLKFETKTNTRLIKNAMYDEFQNNFMLEKQHENLTIDGNLKLINSKGDTVCAKEVLKKNNLIFKYSALNCGECLNVEIDNLSKIRKKYLNEITIIAFHTNNRETKGDLRILKEKGLNNIVIYELVEDKLGVPLDKYNIPFYFYLDSQLKMKNIFIPTKSNTSMSLSYLSASLKNTTIN